MFEAGNLPVVFKNPEIHSNNKQHQTTSNNQYVCVCLKIGLQWFMIIFLIQIWYRPFSNTSIPSQGRKYQQPTGPQVNLYQDSLALAQRLI